MRPSLAVACLFLVAPVSIASPGPPDAAAGAPLNCVMLPDEEVDLGSAVPGVIAEVLVGRSDRVASGQIVARLESSVEQATVELARARAATDAEVQLRLVELGYDAQHRDRLQTLQLRSAASAQNLDDAARVAETSRLRVRLAEDRQREATLERRRADAVLALKSIRSPIDGVIVQRLKTVGEYVETQPLLRIARLDPLRIEVIAPLALFGEVHEGMQMGVRAETDPETERVAKVTAVDAVADPGSGTFGVELELPNPDFELPAGIKCTARLSSPAAGTTVARGPADQASPDGPGSDTVNDRMGPAALSAEARVAAARSAIAAPASCVALQPVDDETHVRSLVETAERLGARADVSEESQIREVGYVVVTPVESRADSRRALADRLRQAGISDLAIIGRGDFAGRVGLGAYNGAESAARRQAALAELGFDTEVLPRTRTLRAWRVELRLPPALEASAVLAALPGGPFAGAGVCEPPQTAAR